MDFKSDFAILDVKSGRADLAKRINRGEKVTVHLTVVLERQHGRDDGTSIEFSGEVTSIREIA